MYIENILNSIIIKAFCLNKSLCLVYRAMLLKLAQNPNLGTLYFIKKKTK